MADEQLRWRIGARIPGHDYKVFTTGFVDGVHPDNGDVHRFSVIDCVDWVNVIALTPDDRVVLVRQYRVGTDTVCLEIPGGMIDPGEDAETAARRELAEETGYVAPRWRKLGATRPNPAIQTNTLHTYLALDAAPAMAQKLDDGEAVAVDTLPIAEVGRLIRAGSIDHALVVVAFAHLALELGELRRP
jgi:8-oxo-dGTP pyrophosphatase MutT (NUDIX family)|nr:NUDIX hydrolase [Kofleriaceae bacterium]